MEKWNGSREAACVGELDADSLSYSDLCADELSAPNICATSQPAYRFRSGVYATRTELD